MSENYKRALKYCFIYVVIFNLILTIFTSVGVFFHFILKHDISVIESWLHFHGWELLIVSKILSFFLFYKLLNIRLYKVISLKELWTQFPNTITSNPWVISIYLWICFSFWGRPEFISSNFTYFFEFILCYVGTSIFYLSDVLILMILFDTFMLRRERLDWKKFLVFPFIFSFSLLIGGQDYYRLMFVAILNMFTLFLLIGPQLIYKLNGLAYVLVFISPFSSLSGMDFLWGHEYSFVKFVSIPGTSFLIIIWVISWIYNQITLSNQRKMDEA